jgi:hypothetical protein
MADLCLRQGHRLEALAIYRRLLARTTDPAAKERVTRRISAVELAGPAPDSPTRAARPASAAHSGIPMETPLPLQNPGVRASWSAGQLTVEWRLPAEIQYPSLQVLLVKTGPDGILTETRAIDVEGPVGLLTLAAGDIHSARVAAGNRGPRGFIPVAVAVGPLER